MTRPPLFLLLAALALPSCAHRAEPGSDGQELVLFSGVLHGLGMGAQLTRDLTLENDPPLCLASTAIAVAAPTAAGILLDQAADRDVDAFPSLLFPGEACLEATDREGPWDLTLVQQAAMDLVDNGLVLIDVRLQDAPLRCEDAAVVHAGLTYIRQIPAVVVGILNGVPNYVLVQVPIDRSACD